MLEEQEQQLCPPSKQQLRKTITETINLLSLPIPQKKHLQAAHRLTAQLCKIPTVLQLLIQILIDPSQSHSHKQASCTIIDNFIRFQTSLTVSEHKRDLTVMHTTLYSAFLKQNIQDGYKIAIERAYVRLIHCDRSSAIRKDLASKISDFFTNNQNLKRGCLIKGMGYLIRSLLHGKIQTDLMKELINHIMDNLGKDLLKNVKCLSESLKERDQTKFREKIQISAAQMEIYKLIFIKTDPDRFPIFKLQLIGKIELSTIIVVVFQLTLPDAEPRFMIEPRDDKDIQLINDLKRYCLQILCNCLRVAQKHKKQQLWEKQTFKSLLITCQALFKVLPQTISKQITAYPISQLPDPILLTEGLRFISLIVKVPQFYASAALQRQLILFKICFQCLLPSAAIRSKTPQQYKQYRQDIANTAQQINTIETNISRIIESYVDNIDGSLTMLVNTIINLVRFLLSAQPLYFQKLPEMLINSYFYKQNNFEDQIECGLLILSVVSYRVEGRQDIAQTIDAFFRAQKDYFYKVDLNHYVRSAFFLLYSYYVDNFYMLIKKGIINPDFHLHIFQFFVNIVSHLKSIESKEPLAHYSILQAYDCISNTINQNLFIQVLFQNPSTHPMLIDTISNLINHLLDKQNVQLADILSEFFKERLRIHTRIGLETINPLIRNQICTTMAIKLADIFPKIMINRTIICEKIFQILRLDLMVSMNPIQIYPFLRQFILNFDKYADNELNILQCTGIILGSIKQKVNHHPTSANIIIEITQILIKNGLIYVQQMGRYDCLFGNFQTIIYLGCLVEDLLKGLMTVFLSSVQITLQQHTAYLMLSIAYSKYSLISVEIWNQVIQSIFSQLQKDYIKQQSAVYGKLISIVLCCLAIDFPYWNNIYSGLPMQTLWKLILANQKTYQTYTQQKVCILKLIQFMKKYQVDISSAKQMIRMAIVLTYYSRNGGQINWADDHDESSNQESDNGEYWEKAGSTIAKNCFLDNLEDEAAKLRDLCNLLLRGECSWFKDFVEQLPIAIKNFLKNRVLMYQGGLAHSNTSLRRIYKVKRCDIPQ